MGILHNFPTEILTQILQKMKLPVIKRITEHCKHLKKQIMADYFLWRAKCTPLETSEDVNKLMERVKWDCLIGDALTKHRMSPRVVITYQTDITMIKTSKKFVIVSSDDSSIKAYSLNSLLNKKFMGHKGGVWDFSFTEKYLASSSIDKSVKLWDMATGDCVLTLNGHTSTVRTVKLTEDRIISGGRDGTIRIWDLQGNCIFILENHKASVRCLDICGDELISCSYDGSVYLWNWRTGELIKEFQKHKSRVYVALICQDYYISAGQDSVIHITSKKTNFCKKLSLHKSVISTLSLCYFENKPILISAGLDGIIGIWDIHNQCLIHSITEPPGLLHVKTFSKYIVVGLSTSVKVFNAKTGKFVVSLLEGIQTVHYIEFHDNILAIGLRCNSKCALYFINFNEYVETMIKRHNY